MERADAVSRRPGLDARLLPTGGLEGPYVVGGAGRRKGGRGLRGRKVEEWEEEEEWKGARRKNDRLKKESR